MWIQAANNYARVHRATPEERAWLSDFLSFDELKFKGKGRPVTEQTCMLNKFNDSFPAGLMRTVIDAARKDGIEIQIIDKRIKPCEYNPNANLEWLRDYQGEAVDLVGKRSRGIIWIPTGGGKGEIVVALTRAIPCNWLFVVHRKGLTNDIAKRYDQRAAEFYPGDAMTEAKMRLMETTQKAGIIGDGKWDPATPGPGALTCATFQTLAANTGKPRFDELCANVDAVVFDEAHTLPAQSFWKVAMGLQNAYYRVALSGTPLARGDRRSIYTIAATGPVIYRVRPDLLIARGVLARPKIRMVECEQLSAKATWQGAYGELVVRSTKRNNIIVAMAKKAEKPCLIFVKEIKHGKILKQRLEKAGVACDFTWGSDSQSKRDQAVESLVRGDIDVLIGSVVFQEGLDVPSLESVIIASGGKSIIATLQRIGRGMRSNQGKKKTFEVWDILDKGNKWTERHAKDRRRAYLKERHEVQVIPDP